MTTEHRTIVFAIYPGMTQLDFTGPHQILRYLPGATTIVASLSGGEVEADGLVFGRTTRLTDVPRCDLICVPGGVAATAVANDAAFVGEVRRLGLQATYVTSVCTGSIILGAAGLLRGKRAACHWAWRDLLPLFEAIPDSARVVRDGNVITGGGVTAGIDFALTIAAELAGLRVAQGLQLNFEYAPAPPFNAGLPETAPPEVRVRVTAAMDRLSVGRRAEAARAAAAMRGSLGHD